GSPNRCSYRSVAAVATSTRTAVEAARTAGTVRHERAGSRTTVGHPIRADRAGPGAAVGHETGPATMAVVPVPVITPARVPELSRTPVTGIGSDRARKGFSYARRSQTSKSKTCGTCSSGCNSFDVSHSHGVPLAPGDPNA